MSTTVSFSNIHHLIQSQKGRRIKIEREEGEGREGGKKRERERKKKQERKTEKEREKKRKKCYFPCDENPHSSPSTAEALTASSDRRGSERSTGKKSQRQSILFLSPSWCGSGCLKDGVFGHALNMGNGLIQASLSLESYSLL